MSEDEVMDEGELEGEIIADPDLESEDLDEDSLDLDIEEDELLADGDLEGAGEEEDPDAVLEETPVARKGKGEEDDEDDDMHEAEDDDEKRLTEAEDDESVATKKTVAESRRFRRALRMWEEAEDEKNEAEEDEKDVNEEDDDKPAFLKKNEAEEDEKDVHEAEDDEKDVHEAEDDEKDVHEAEEDEKAIKESLKIRIKMPSTAIFESAGFDSKQQKRMSAIFESAVKQTTKQVSKQIHEHYRKVAAATTRRNQRMLESRLNTYLEVVVEEWMKTNKVAVRQSLRADLSENFLNGLQRLFKEHYIDVPTSKVNVVEALTREVENLKQQVNEQHTQKLKLRRLAEAANKKRIVAEFARNLSEAKAAKLAKLAEDTEYVNAKDFREKLAMLKESYFDKRPSSMTRLPEEDVQVLKENAHVGKSEVDSVADAISRQVKSDW